jgi:hypothetical protein
VAASASSGLTVAFTSSGSCTNSGATNTMTSATGTCSVVVEQAGNASYDAVTVTEVVNVTVTFTSSGVCSNSGASYRMTRIGKCKVIANQAGNADYASASTVTYTVAVQMIKKGV